MTENTTRDRAWHKLLLELAELEDEDDYFQIKDWEGFSESDLHTVRRVLKFAEKRGWIRRPHSRSGEWHRGQLANALINTISDSPFVKMGMDIEEGQAFQVERRLDGEIVIVEVPEDEKLGGPFVTGGVEEQLNVVAEADIDPKEAVRELRKVPRYSEVKLVDEDGNEIPVEDDLEPLPDAEDVTLEFEYPDEESEYEKDKQSKQN